MIVRSRWLWRARIERQRLQESLRGSRLRSNPRLGFVLIVVLWAGLVASHLFSGLDKALNAYWNAVLNTALISLTFGIFLYFGSNRRVARRLRIDVRNDPTVLLGGEPSPTGTVSNAREALYEDIAEDLTDVAPIGPQAIIGEAGSGKTSALIGLARFLAQRGMVPVYVSMRGVAQLDFLALARERFDENVDRYVASSSDAERVWRWLCRSKRLVVLADDLHEALVVDGGGHDIHALRNALESARRRRLAVAVTSRPAGVPESIAPSAIALPPLGEDAAVEEILHRAGPAESELTERIRDHVYRGQLREAPFYLDIAGRLAEADALPNLAGEESHNVVRGILLHAYEQQLVQRKLLSDVPIGPEERSRTFDLLRKLAIVGLASPAGEIAKLTADIPHPDTGDATEGQHPSQLLDAGERLGLIECDKETIRFSHDIIQSYLASTLIRNDDRLLRHACERLQTVRAVNAVVLAVAGGGASDLARRACGHLLACASHRADDWGLVLLRAAADVAEIFPQEDVDTRIVEAVGAYVVDDLGADAERPIGSSGSLTRLSVVPRLARLRTDERWHTLWALTNDADYRVKWEAATALRQAAVDAYPALAIRFHRYIREAYALSTRLTPEEVDDWKHREVFRLKMLSWVLPSLATGLARAGLETSAAEADLMWEQIVRLEQKPITVQRGLEAAMAQGMKADALGLLEGKGDAPSERIEHARRRTLEMLENSRFWYSRIQLIHALAVLERIQATANRSTQAMLREIATSTDEHPFTVQAARLAARAIRANDWRTELWEDEAVAVSARNRLSDAASQLLADITLALNLNESGAGWQRRYFGGCKKLPFCLLNSNDRAEILGRRECPPECPFQMCPYERPVGESAYRGLSKTFCRQQRLIARRTTPRYQRIAKAALRTFWQQMEERTPA